MSVLQRKELESSPLADLHAIASELGLDGYRGLRKAQLIDAILGEGGNGASESSSDDAAPAAVEEAAATEDASGDDSDAEPAEEARERPSRSRRRGGRGRKPSEDEGERDEPVAKERKPAAEEPEDAVDDEPAEERLVTGVLDILPNGSGYVRADGEEIYVSPAQIRRCELRAGDDVSGPVRPARRNERHPSLIRVDGVNGRDAEPPEERPRFEDLTPIFPRERLKAPALLDGVPLGRGSRVVVAGPPGAGSTALLREVVGALAGQSELEVQVVLAGVRPEEVAEWREAAGDAPVSGGSFERSGETIAQAAELAVERAKRRVERGGHVAIVVDSLESLPPSAARRVLGAARATEEGGSLTVVAAVGEGPEPLRWATSRVVLSAPAEGATAPTVDAARSGTLRADRLG